MELLVIAVLGMLAIAGAAQLSDRTGVASPLILLALGIAVGFLPFVPAVEIEPEVVLEGILPPLLYSTAVGMPTMDFRRELTAVAVLAVGLVALSSAAIGVFLTLAVPGTSLAWGIAMGAVLSPTDAVAISIARRLGVSPRIITVLEGEGLLNDATALVILSSAVTAATAGHVTVGGVLGGFLAAVLVAVALGWAVGEATLRVRSRVADSTVDTVLSFTVPFLAALPAERLGGSGLVAAVVAGLVTGYRGPRLLPPGHRVANRQNWHTVELVLEGLIFLVMGLELFGIVEELGSSSPGLARAVWVSVLGGLVAVLVRAGVVAPMLVLLHRRVARRSRRFDAMTGPLHEFEERCCAIARGERDTLAQVPWDRPDHVEHPGRRRVRALTALAGGDRYRLERTATWTRTRIRRAGADLDYFAAQPLGAREGAVIVWAGMRGAVTLAAAQTLPATAPHRPFLLFVAILLAAGSLTIQGQTLPAVVRLVRPAMADRADDAERDSLVRLLVTAAKDQAIAVAQEDDAVDPAAAGDVPVVAGQGGPGDPDETAPPAEAPGGTGDDGAAPTADPAGTRNLVTGRPTVRRDGDELVVSLPRSLDRAISASERRLAQAEASRRALGIIRAQRDALLDARDDGLYSAETLEYALGRLDYEEIMLTTRPA